MTSDPEDKVIDIATRRPHVTGEVACLQCSHRWVAVAPVGVYELECGTLKGVHVGLTIPDAACWQCRCGCALWFYSETGNLVCSYCGNISNPT